MKMPVKSHNKEYRKRMFTLGNEAGFQFPSYQEPLTHYIERYIPSPLIDKTITELKNEPEEPKKYSLGRMTPGEFEYFLYLCRLIGDN